MGWVGWVGVKREARVFFNTTGSATLPATHPAQERYASLAPLYYRGAAAAAVVYSVTDRESFARAAYWAGELARAAAGDPRSGGGDRDRAGGTAPPPITVLVGNKADLGDDRVVTAEEGAALAAEHGALFAETSAKTAEGVGAVFETAAGAVLDGWGAAAA